MEANVKVLNTFSHVVVLVISRAFTVKRVRSNQSCVLFNLKISSVYKVSRSLELSAKILSLKVDVHSLVKTRVYVQVMTCAVVPIHSLDLFATVLDWVVNITQLEVPVRSYKLVIVWAVVCIGSNHMVNLNQLLRTVI